MPPKDPEGDTSAAAAKSDRRAQRDRRRQEQAVAARVIQTHYRAKVAKAVKTKLQEKHQDAAAALIQARVRAPAVKKEVEQRRDEAKQKEEATKVLQGRVRRMQAVQEMTERKEHLGEVDEGLLEDAAVVIQTRYRGKAAVELRDDLKKGKGAAPEQQEEAALQIQAAIRGSAAKQEAVQRQKTAGAKLTATKLLQAKVRQLQIVRTLTQVKQQAEKMKQQQAREEEQLVKAAQERVAVLIQRRYRHQKALQDMNRRRDHRDADAAAMARLGEGDDDSDSEDLENAILTIQAKLRGKQERNKAKELIYDRDLVKQEAAVLQIQSKSRRLSAKLAVVKQRKKREEQNWAAALIQARYKGKQEGGQVQVKLAEARQEETVWAVNFIQARLRGKSVQSQAAGKLPELRERLAKNRKELKKLAIQELYDSKRAVDKTRTQEVMTEPAEDVWSAVKKAQRAQTDWPLAPLQLFVVSRHGYEGVYILLGGEGANGYSGLSGQWLIGDDNEATKGFNCSSGLVANAEPHEGFMPHRMKPGSWLRFDGVAWTADGRIHVTTTEQLDRAWQQRVARAAAVAQGDEATDATGDASPEGRRRFKPMIAREVEEAAREAPQGEDAERLTARVKRTKAQQASDHRQKAILAKARRAASQTLRPASKNLSVSPRQPHAASQGHARSQTPSNRFAPGADGSVWLVTSTSSASGRASAPQPAGDARAVARPKASEAINLLQGRKPAPLRDSRPRSPGKAQQKVIHGRVPAPLR
eukprot:TRINITY_DN10545_c0_g1_i3.p1 TRINITY_DN10545_c0_g1~~TRINITY_DN10545_c0_g1_i3.p1  ORF type:complete len:757 (-),score=181.80 TRINITY_DN10545_c0_g1_i3:31-2301(-)